MLVRDIIDRCDTGLARGLSKQLIAKLNRLSSTQLLVKIDNQLIDTSSKSVNSYLQVAANLDLIAAVKRRNQVLTINSCLRTTVQQHIIYKQFRRGLCGITAAARPGTSNHESGLAIDIQEPDNWETELERQNWKRLGQWDKPHYDYSSGRRDIAALQIRAFQMLWNQHNSTDQILVDGIYGNSTATRIDNSPVDGW